MIMRSRTKRLLVLATASGFVWLLPLAAQEVPPIVEEDDSVIEIQRCVNTRPISRTEILDDQDILFYMRNGEIYLNHLRKTCKRLAEEGRFAYSTMTSRLCTDDIISVLTDSGFGLTTGRSCKLGNFYAVTEEQAEKIKAPRTIEPKPVPPAEPQEPRTDETGEASEKAPTDRDD
jgi:hypothetical protein